MAHSFDLHAARVAAGTAFRDIRAGKSMTLSFTAHDPGVYVYHCVTSPAVMHIAMGMYGAMVVTPAKPLPPADHEFVLVGGGGISTDPAGTNRPTSISTRPWTCDPTSGSRSTALPTSTSRPTRCTSLRASLRASMSATPVPTSPSPFTWSARSSNASTSTATSQTWLSGVQTTSVAPGAGAIFEARFEQPGANGFVNHAFANAHKGAQGTILVGDATGRMTH